MYVIQREDGAYVTNPGSERSYSKFLQDARLFDTREQAEREVCPGNERILDMGQAFKSR